MASWGDFDESEEWDAAPAVVQKKKIKKKTEAVLSGEWGSANARTVQKDAATLSTPSSTAVAAASSAPEQRQQQSQQQQPLESTPGETVDLDALQQKVSELDAQLEVEEQDRLIREALLVATDNSIIFDLKEMHGNVRTCSARLLFFSSFFAVFVSVPLPNAYLAGSLAVPLPYLKQRSSS